MKIHDNDRFPSGVLSFIIWLLAAGTPFLISKFLIQPNLEFGAGLALTILVGILSGIFYGFLLRKVHAIKLGPSKKYFIKQQENGLLTIVCKKFGKYYYAQGIADPQFCLPLIDKDSNIVSVSLAYENAYEKCQQAKEEKRQKKASPFVYQHKIKG